jgi:hypothetical protein
LDSTHVGPAITDRISARYSFEKLRLQQQFRAEMPLSGQASHSERNRKRAGQMNVQLLKETVKLLFADDKGLLAMDESTGPVTSVSRNLVFRRPLKREGLIEN